MDEQLNELLELVRSYINDEKKIESIKKAFHLSYQLHKNQKRKSGENYFNHLFEVAKILSKVKADSDSIIVGLLHDTLEDTTYTENQLQNDFSGKIYETIKSLTKIKSPSNKKEKDLDEYLKKLIIGVSSNKEILLIKLADRLHNMRTLEYMQKEKQIQISEETRKIYIPIASRLGLHWLKSELEDLTFYYLENSSYKKIEKLVNSKSSSNPDLIVDAVKILKEDIEINKGVLIDIYGRRKHLYSIFSKIKKGKSYNQIYDLLAIRIITKSTIDCYHILGIISGKYNLIPGRFKDYITNPKENFYQALHLGLVIDKSYFEIQIMTEEMQLKSLIGLSSHTKYKETHTKLLQNNNFIDYILEYSNNLGRRDVASKFIDVINDDLLTPTFSVLTPTGDKVILNKGSTALDFAFKIHTELAIHSEFALIDGERKKLNSILQEGDIVEIKTNSRKSLPLNAIQWVTSKQNAEKIRNLHSQKNEKIPVKIDINYGKQIIQDYKNKNPEYTKVLSDKMLSIVSKKLEMKNIEELYIKLANKELNMFKIIRELRNSSKTFRKYESQEKTIIRKSRAFLFPEESQYLNNTFKFILADCNPVYGEPIKAEINKSLINRDKKITIHRGHCSKSLENEKSFIDINWNHEADGEFFYNSSIMINAYNNRNILKEILNSVDIVNAEVVDFNSTSDELTESIKINLKISIQHINQLERFFLNLNNIIGIIDVERI